MVGRESGTKEREVTMFNRNQAYLVGNVTKDVECGQTRSGKSVAHFTVACNEQRQGDEKPRTEFVRVCAWTGFAELAGQLKKGDTVVVEGRISTSSYEQNGVKKYSTEVIATNLGFLKRMARREGDQAEGESTAAAPVGGPNDGAEAEEAQ